MSTEDKIINFEEWKENNGSGNTRITFGAEVVPFTDYVFVGPFRPEKPKSKCSAIIHDIFYGITHLRRQLDMKSDGELREASYFIYDSPPLPPKVAKILLFSRKA